MKPFFAVDWGTSSLRLALLDEGGAVLQQHATEQGILHVSRDQFAPVLIAAHARFNWPAAAFYLMAGMVGSRQGWYEAPYLPCPAGFAGMASQLAWLPSDLAPGGARIAIVPGLRCDNDSVPDVMRGEETQVFGAMSLLGISHGLFVLPGTHSKWVQVAQGCIQRFSTFMTGELYGLLRNHSILSRTLPPDDGPLDEAAFLRGVRHAAAATGGLLNSAFSVRTLALFDALAPGALPSYLSGLLIGEELRVQPAQGLREPVVVIGADHLTQRYALALRELGAAVRTVGEQATWRGLWELARQLEPTE